MPVRSALALASLLLLVAACDTGDGKTMRPPSSEQRAAMTTTTSTTTTVVGLPADVGADGALTQFGSSPTAVAPSVPAAASVVPAASFALTVPWAAGEPMDARFTCDGADLSPLLTWTAPPAGTVELALMVTDDDAGGYVHWAVAGIPPTAGEKGEGGTITGALEGTNDFGTVGWGGPCPPAGTTHHYRFALYALDQQAELPEGFTGADLLAIANPGSIGLAEASGTYTRPG